MTLQQTFDAALASLVSAAELAAVSKDAHATVNATATGAYNGASWAAFDLAGNDVAKAEELAEAIATARGSKPETFKVYRQRARNAATAYYKAIAGVALDKRAKRNPYTLAKKFAEDASKQAARITGLAQVIPEAKSVAAGVLETSIPDLEARLHVQEAEALEVFAAAIEEVKGRATLRADLMAVLSRARVADADTVSFALEAVAGFTAWMETLAAASVETVEEEERKVA